MSTEDILFTSRMLCPYCIKYLEQQGSYFYCNQCGKTFDSIYSITQLGDTNVNNIKLIEQKDKK